MYRDGLYLLIWNGSSSIPGVRTDVHVVLSSHEEAGDYPVMSLSSQQTLFSILRSPMMFVRMLQLRRRDFHASTPFRNSPSIIQGSVEQHVWSTSLRSLGGLGMYRELTA